MQNIHLIVILLIIHCFHSLHFENIQICAAYKSYPTSQAHYGTKGVPSPQNYFSARHSTASVYSKTKNKLYVFGGHGEATNGIPTQSLFLSFQEQDFSMISGNMI
jgi:hypothetical protein